MNKEIKDQWVAALRSGEYAQTRNALTRIADDGSASHCCLGVLCELAVKDVDIPRVIVSWVGGRVIKYGQEETFGILPGELCEWSGMDSDVGSVDIPGCGIASLTDLNDECNFTFDQIADVIDYFGEDL